MRKSHYLQADDFHELMIHDSYLGIMDWCTVGYILDGGKKRTAIIDPETMDRRLTNSEKVERTIIIPKVIPPLNEHT